MPSRAYSIPLPERAFSPRKVRRALIALFLLSAALWFSSRAIQNAAFLPHWYCYAGNTPLLWTHVISDFVIGLSYFTISATLVWLVRRAGRDLAYSGFFWAFGLFIVTCGSTHFLEILTVWKPVYWLSAGMKTITGVVSMGTAVVLLIAKEDIVVLLHTAREAALRRGNERFRALIQAVPMAVIGLDREGLINYWNPSAEKIFGLKAEQVLGKQNPVVPPEMRAEYETLLQKSLSGEVTAGHETVRMRADGCRFPVSVSHAPVYDEDGALIGLMAVVEDISKRKRIELELKEMSAVLATVTEALNIFLDTGDWSAASRRLLTFAICQTHSEYGFLGVVLDGPVLRVLAHDGVAWDMRMNREMYEAKIWQHATQGYFEIAHQGNFLGEVITKGVTVVANAPESDPRSGGAPTGHPPMHSFLGVPIFKGQETVGLIAVANRPGGYSGQELRYLETMSQATGVLYDSYRQSVKRAALEEQQKRLEAQIRQAQKMEVLGRLAGGVAHDFNNMLMVLGGCCELLERSLPKETPARAHLEQIQRTTEKAAAVTKQLLTFSRKQVLELRPMDLHEALTESELMLPRLLGSDIELTFHHDAAHSWIRSDPSQIEQVVANLAINARDAMPDGGRLTFATRNATHLPEGSAEAAAGSPEKAWVVLEVADTGSGMDEKTRAQIFEPFFTTKPVGKGTGLGLATVYGIAKQSGGHIHVESMPGKGTRFELYFPTTKPQVIVAKSPARVDVQEDSDGEATILLADDEPVLRHALSEFLSSSGYEVLEAQTSAEALEKAQQHCGRIDILLTDMVMPGLRGTELARRVALIHPGIQVVYMSGDAENLPEAQVPPHATFLQKPFRFAMLLEELKLVRRRV